MPQFNERQRQKHPVLRLFPASLWFVLFKSQYLSDNQLKLMKKKLHKIGDDLKALQREEQLQSWLCILIQHPQNSKLDLVLKVSSVLPIDILIAGALVSNRIDILTAYANTTIKDLPPTTFNPLDYAILSGSIEPLRWLEANYTPDTLKEMIRIRIGTTDDYGVFRRAAGWGHLDILQWFEKKDPALFQRMISAN